MSNQNGGGAPADPQNGVQDPANNNPSPGGQNQNDGGTYPAAFVQKLMDEKKAATRRVRELEEQQQNSHSQSLVDQGKYEEAIEALRNENVSLKANFSERLSKAASGYIEKQISLQAQEMGCVDNDAACAFIDFKEIGFDDETFSVDADKVKLSLETLKESKPYLFQTRSLPPRDGSLNGKMNQDDLAPEKKPTSLEDMDVDQMKSGLASLIAKDFEAGGR